MIKNGFIFFWGGEYSQWYKSNFVIDGVQFNCAEQYMMYMKAKTFGDSASMVKILHTADPKQQKKLGRQVIGFYPDVWNAIAKDIVFRGNFAKFTQNPILNNLIVNSKNDGDFVEASPYDKIWGIGLGADNPLAWDESTWQGTNWLGEVLTELREGLL